MKSQIQIANSLSDALKSDAKLVLIDGGWPSFDASDRAYFTPGSDKYIEAERLPPDWLALVGKTVCADITTVGTIADLLEELPPDVREEWRSLYAKLNDDGGEEALDAFEAKHHIRWYGEGYYIDDGEGEDEDGEEDGAPFALESVTPAALSAEKERQRQREEIARRIAQPLKGSGRVEVQPQFDLGQTGQMDLFAPIVERTVQA